MTDDDGSLTEWDSTLSDFRVRQRHRLLDAARRLLARHPVDELSMQAVADEAGVTRPTVYKYFSDLHTILAGVAVAWLEEIEREATAAIGPGAGPPERLNVLLSTMLTNVAESELRGLANANLHPEAAVVVVAQLERFRVHLVETLTDGVDQGWFRADLDPEADSRILMVMLDGVRRSLQGGYVAAGDIDRVVDMIRRSVTAGAGADGRDARDRN